MGSTSQDYAYDTLDAAMLYVEYGWPIFFCAPGNKRPYQATRGYKDATGDVRKIERFLRRNPDANIATPTGHVFDVLDLDDVSAFEKLDGSIPITVQQRTPSAGLHFLLKHSDGITNARGQLPDGIDVRGLGGYVLLPPSVVNGQRYVWLNSPEDYELAEWPDWLLDVVQSNGFGPNDWEPLDVEAIFEGVPHGQRDEAAHKYASRLRGLDVPKKEALSFMRLAWEQMEQPDRDKFALETALEKVENAYRRYGPNAKKVTPLRVRSPDMDLARPVEWVWHHRIPSSYMSLVLGREGVGKSTLIRWVVAQLTRGKLEGEYYGESIHVGIIGEEDDFDNIWTPALEAVQSRSEYVHYIDRPNFGYIDLTEDQDRIDGVVREYDIRILYLDQLLDHIGLKVDDWRSKQVRDALRPAVQLARSLDVAVVGALHPNKRGNSFRELMSGSIAFNAVSRSSLLLTNRLDEPGRCVLVRGKGNLSPEPSAFEFDIKGYRLKYNDLVFEGPMVDAQSISHTDLTQDDLIGPDADRTVETKTGRMVELLHEMLPNDGDYHLAQPIIDRARTEGISDPTIYRAVKRVRLDRKKEGAEQARALWRWPFRVTLRRRKKR